MTVTHPSLSSPVVIERASGLPLDINAYHEYFSELEKVCIPKEEIDNGNNIVHISLEYESGTQTVSCNFDLELECPCTMEQGSDTGYDVILDKIEDTCCWAIIIENNSDCDNLMIPEIILEMPEEAKQFLNTTTFGRFTADESHPEHIVFIPPGRYGSAQTPILLPIGGRVIIGEICFNQNVDIDFRILLRKFRDDDTNSDPTNGEIVEITPHPSSELIDSKLMCEPCDCDNKYLFDIAKTGNNDEGNCCYDISVERLALDDCVYEAVNVVILNDNQEISNTPFSLANNTITINTCTTVNNITVKLLKSDGTVDCGKSFITKCCDCNTWDPVLETYNEEKKLERVSAVPEGTLESYEVKYCCPRWQAYLDDENCGLQVHGITVREKNTGGEQEVIPLQAFPVGLTTSIFDFGDIFCDWGGCDIPFMNNYELEVIFYDKDGNVICKKDLINPCYKELLWEFSEIEARPIDYLSSCLIAPNPAVDQVTLTFNLDKQCQAEIQLFDQSGELMANISKSQFEAGENNVEFQTKEYASGYYLVNIKIEGQSFSIPLVIVR